MSKRDVERFAEQLIRLVRDEAISGCKSITKPDAKSPVARRWKARGAVPSEEVIADIVDSTLFELLNAIDCGDLDLRFVLANGRVISLEEEGEGEMGGSYMMTGGWRQRFSKELVTDDFADLA